MVSNQNLNFGKKGEDLAVSLLIDNGYIILERNFRTKFGEIDIIAKDKGTFAFVEVKTRRSENFGLPLEAISKAKQRKISKMAVAFSQEKGLLGKMARFDVISIIYSVDGGYEFKLFKDAFELEEGVNYAI